MITQKANFLKVLKNLYFVKNEPISLVHFVTNRCNARCSFCFIDFDDPKTFKGELNLNEIQTLTKNLGSSLLNVNLTGGEPFARKDLADIAKLYLNNTPVQSIYITTNASLPDRIENFANVITDFEKNIELTFQISIDDFPEKHNKVRKIENLFENCIDTYFRLKNHKKNVNPVVSITVTHENCDDIEEMLDGIDGLLIPGGFGDRGTEGKINAAQFARNRGIPYFGICLGMQIATIEFARNVANLEDANSTEFDQNTPHPVICLLDEQKSVTHKGASMRLGTWVCDLKPDTKSFNLYKSSTINERHRHRFEFNSDYREQLEKAGLVIAGTSPDGHLVEIIELANHPFYVACQFHPEFLSRPNYSHPLFKGFVAAALARRIGVAKYAEEKAIKK